VKSLKRAAIGAGFTILIAGCDTHIAPAISPTTSSRPSSAPTSVKSWVIHYDPVHAVLPDPNLTPGATFPGVTAQDVCTPGWASEHRHVTEEMRMAVDQRYARADEPPYPETDHLIPLGLGGTNSILNLWPQPYQPHPGAGEKDSLEDNLHQLVCTHKITLADAQHCIASNWVECWKKYVVPGYGAQWAAENRHGW
jgi:hypothetical protein